MSEFEPQGSSELEKLKGKDFMVIFPVQLSKVIAIDLRQSYESFPNVTVFSLKELISDKLIREMSKYIRRAAEINLASVAEIINQYSLSHVLTNRLTSIVGLKLKKMRPDAEPLTGAVIFTFALPLSGFVETELWMKVKNTVEERGSREVAKELEDVVCKLVTEEKETLQKIRDDTLGDVVTGDGYATLWQRPQSN